MGARQPRQQQEVLSPTRLHTAAEQDHTQQPRQQQQQVLYRVRVASPEAANRLVSPSCKLSLHRSVHSTVYVEPWLTPSQQQARRNMRSTVQQLLMQLHVRLC
jgi:hypothetical protein